MFRSAFLALALAAWLSPAVAEPPACGPVSAMLAELHQRYGERPAVAATTGDRPLLWVANPATGTWSLLLQPQPGIACLIAAGQDWRVTPAGDPA
ncbi:MAG: hypothetical protein OHK0024_21090 [Thalassobaculales bacterium]